MASVGATNDFQPESLVAYAGMAKALALEQLIVAFAPILAA